MPKEKRHYYKEVRLRQIRALVQIARQGGFASAARELLISGPSVWVQIRSLEREFGATLVQARGSDVSLTPDGELLVRLAAPLMEGFDSLRSIFTEQQGQLHRSLTLATTTTLLTYELAPLIASYRKQNPDVELTFMDCPSLESRRIFEQGRADIAIVGHSDDMSPPLHSHIHELHPHVFHLVCPPDHPLLTKRKVTLEDVTKHPLILPGEGSVVHEQLLKTLATTNAREAGVAVTSSNFALLTSYVQMGFGIGILALGPQMIEHWSRFTGGQLRIRDASHIFANERVIFLQRTGGHELHHVKQFRETVLRRMQAVRPRLSTGSDGSTTIKGT